MLSLPIGVGLQQGTDLLAGAVGPDRAEHQAVFAPRQVGLAQHGPAPRQPLPGIDVVEGPRAQAVRLERPRKTLARRPGTPEVEIPVAKGPARQVFRAQPEHRVLAVGGPGAGEAAGRIAPLEQRLGDLGQLPPALDHAQEQIPILRPAVVLPAVLQGLAPERRARMHQRGLDEAAVAALLLAEGLVEPPFQAEEAPREGSREAAHQAARRADRRLVEEHLRLEAKAIGMDQVVGVHAGDQLSPAARKPQVQRGDQAAAFAADHADARVLPAGSGEERRRRVDRGVIDADHFQRGRIALRKHAGQRFRYCCRSVLGGKQYADQHGLRLYCGRDAALLQASKRKLRTAERALDRALRQWNSRTVPALLQASEDARQPAPRKLSKMLRKRLQRLEERLEAARKRPTPKTLHRARISVKQVRYLLQVAKDA